MYFPLHPDTPDEGQTLEELFRGRAYDLEAMHARMKGLMDAEGLAYGRRTTQIWSESQQSCGAGLRTMSAAGWASCWWDTSTTNPPDAGSDAGATEPARAGVVGRFGSGECLQLSQYFS